MFSTAHGHALTAEIFGVVNGRVRRYEDAERGRLERREQTGRRIHERQAARMRVDDRHQIGEPQIERAGGDGRRDRAAVVEILDVDVQAGLLEEAMSTP